MLRFLASVTIAAALLVGCAGEAPEIPLGADGEPDPELVVGRSIYSQRCQTCHAADGSGGSGKNLQGVEEAYTIEEQIAIIGEGPGAMPEFAGDLSPDEIAAVARYTREVL